VEKERRQQKKVPFFSSLQMKYALSYLAVFAVVLVLLNTYPLIASQDLLFTSKGDSLKSQATVMSSALMELENLSSDQVARVMSMLGDGELDRILVTDPAGQILFDSKAPTPAEEETEQYRYALFQEIVTALRGEVVVYSNYVDRTFVSTAAAPIVYRGMTIGAIYILDVDEAQGALLYNLQKNLRSISIVVAVVTLLMSALFSQVLGTRIAALLRAIRIVGEGEYGHRLQSVGHDELAQLADEFNQLTDRLQTTEEVRRRFVADASHELKTPLASIRLLSDSILQNSEMDPETIRDFVGDIDSEAGRLARITEHLLALTKLDSLPAAQTEPVDVAKVAAQAANILAPVAEAAGVTVEQNLKSDCIIRCTEDELYQVCFNLVENAIKYNFTGGRVYLTVYRDADQVLLEVGDTGVGIPDADLPKIFNRFYRVDKARSRAAGGTGLGLSIVRDTVRRHGGWITARARSPQGTVFTAGFPQYVPGREEERL